VSSQDLIAAYAAAPPQLRAAVQGMSPEQLRARPVAGRWSTLEVLCHLSDAEILYAHRIKLVLAEDEPPLQNLDPETWVRRLACHDRDAEEELRVVEAVRAQMARILRTLPAEDFLRRGLHSIAGPLTVTELLTRVTNHLPHHLRFIEEKRAALST
jgi:uncharacterized damage-inducible protein DinB